MKKRLKKFVELSAGKLTTRILEKNQPLIISVTGSVGKTSTKDAIYSVVKTKFKANKSRGGLNTEFGLPLAIAGYEKAEVSAGFWLGALGRLFKMNVSKEACSDLGDVLVLEMGVDYPGDMEKLVNIAPPSIGVVTNVSVSHLEKFKNINKTIIEKRRLVEALPKQGFAILCGDDEKVLEMQKKTKAQVLTFGLMEHNLVRATNISFNWSGLQPDGQIEWGMIFKLNYNDKVVPVRIKNALGIQQVYAALAAAAVGIALGFNLLEIAEALLDYEVANGRLKVIKGREGSLILDDSYNSAPASALAALDVLDHLTGKKKIAVLGDMLELGDKEKRGHEEVGKMAAEVADILLTYGERSKLTAKKAKEIQKKTGREMIIEHFSSQQELVEFLEPFLKERTIILVKGSRGIKMENVVKAIMADPDQALELLVGQDN